jgi:hypothetical protein
VGGLKVSVAPGGRFDALIVTALVNGPFIELTTMVKFAEAPGGMSCRPVLEATVKSAGGGVTTRVTGGEVAGAKFASPL